MAKKIRTRFDKGIQIEPENIKGEGGEDLTLEGELGVDTSDDFLKIYLDGSTRTVVTADQTQTLTNKTINADNSTISNLETDNLKSGVLNTNSSLNGASNTQIPSALAVKSLVATTQGNLDDHIANTTGAHAASAITNTPSGNISATTVQGAINELDSEKQANITGAASTITSSNLTASRVLTSDSSGKVSASSTTTTTLGYLDVTSSLQGLLNAKAPLASPTFTGTPNTTNPSNGTFDTRIASTKWVSENALTYIADIPDSADLNNYTTQGMYHQNSTAYATNGSNYPVALAGMLTVKVDGQMIYQVYEAYNGTGTYYRTKYNTTWYAWQRCATTSEVAGKENSITAGTTGQYWRGDKTWQTLNKSAVGLGNVDNTSDANKPISTATQTALDGKVDKLSSTTANEVASFSGTDGKTLQNTTARLTAAGVLSGLTGLTTSGTLTGSGRLILSAETASTVSGSNATVTVGTGTSHYRFTNSSLQSIGGTSTNANGWIMFFENATGNDITIVNEDTTIATAANRIKTGTGGNITLKNEGVLLLKYNNAIDRWLVVGGAGGAGGADLPDTFVQLIATENLTDWSTGDNATFLGGGTLSGSFVKETSSPLNGIASYKYTQTANSLNDYLASPVKDVPIRFRGNFNSIVFPFKYDGTTNDISLVVWDVTNSAKLTEDTLYGLPTTGTNTSIFKANFFIPSNCTQIRVGFHVKSVNSGKILQFDDVQVSADLTKYLESTQVQSSRLNANGTWTGVLNGTLFSSSGGGLYTYNSTTGVYTVLKKCEVTISATIRSGTTSRVVVQVIMGGVQGARDTTGALSGVYASVTQAAVLEPGDTFYGEVVTSGNADVARVAVSAIGINESIITATDSFSSETTAFTYANAATYTLSTLANAPVGTYITFTYGANSNTRTQTTGSNRPTQTDSDMAINGIRIYTRAYNAASTSASPSCFAIQIGKGYKGLSLDLYKSTGKDNRGSIDKYLPSTTSEQGLGLKEYNENTGVLIIDAGIKAATSNTSHMFLFSEDLSTQNNGYLFINASKSPALVGITQNRPMTRAVQSSGQTIATATFTTLTYDSTKSFDNTASLNTSTGVYSVPDSGYYQINAAAMTDNVAWTSGNSLAIYIYINSLPYSSYANLSTGSWTNYWQVSISDTAYLNKGDTVEIKIRHTRGSNTSLRSDDDFNRFSITKLN